MERRVLGNWHARCGAGEKTEKYQSFTYGYWRMMMPSCRFNRGGQS